jgi:hypothetical protein
MDANLDMSLDQLAAKSAKPRGGGGKSPKMSGRSGRVQKAAPYQKKGGGGSGSRRVYVGNLDWSVSWQDLKDHFRECGEVIYADVMTEGGKGKGRSKGCGIVEFETAKEAKKVWCTIVLYVDGTPEVVWYKCSKWTS